MIKCVILSLLSCFPVMVCSQVAVIVSEKNEINVLTKEQVSNIYLGRSYYLPDGVKVIPLDQSEGQKSREIFYDKVVEKSQSQINSHWSRQIFSGKGRPPFIVNGDEEMLELISANPNMIGYVYVRKDAMINRKGVKSVLEME